MKISRDVLEIAAFIFCVGLVLLGFEWYLWTRKGETLSQQFWRLWEEKPKVATALWVILLIALGIIVLHLRR